MNKTITKFKLSQDRGMYALLCDDQNLGNPIFDPLICGVYPSYKEAREVANDLKDCACSHTIKQVTLTIEYEKQRQTKRNKKGGKKT